MKRIHLWGLSIIAIFLSSCELDDVLNPTTKGEVLAIFEEYALVNKVYLEVGNTSDQAINTAEQGGSALSLTNKNAELKPEITMEPADLTTFPKTITVDFGEEGMTLADGILRKGKIKTVSSAWMSVKGSVHTTTFENYFYNNYQVQGVRVSTNESGGTGEQSRFRVKIENGKITAPSGESIFYTQDSYHTLIAGAETPLNFLDNEYQIEGTQKGISSDDIEFEATVKEPLHFVVDPRELKAGVIALSVGTYKNIEVDYSNSTITIAGIEFPIKKL